MKKLTGKKRQRKKKFNHRQTTQTQQKIRMEKILCQMVAQMIMWMKQTLRKSFKRWSMLTQTA